MRTPNLTTGIDLRTAHLPEVRGWDDEPSEGADALVGLEVDGLVIERIVAEGGMGVVCAAREKESGRPVALKVLRACHAGDVGLKSRFEREIRFGMRVSHPNVAPMLGHGWLPDGRPYYRMELYRGATLGSMVRATGPLELERALAVTDQILAGLEAVHGAGIVHRDLQPDNVMLIPGPRGRDHVVLLDFGFAHEPGVDTGDGVTPDSPGSLVGTLLFMSPEQVTRARAITARSDLFATALLFYYAATGKLPFRGSGELDVAVATVRRPPVPLRSERRNVPRALDAWLSRALAKHPDARFPGATEMRAELQAIAEGCRRKERGAPATLA
jgi:serine/threonine-protein kinase